MKKISAVIFLILIFMPTPCLASCNEDERFLTDATIYSNYLEENKNFFRSLEDARNSAGIITKASSLDYVNTLFEFLCDGKFKKTKVPIDCHANYIVIDIFDSRKDKMISFSSDGYHLYTDDGWYRKVDKKFRLKFHFSDDDLKVYFIRREQKNHECEKFS